LPCDLLALHGFSVAISRGGAVGVKTKTVLIVDDEKLVCDFFSRVLAKEDHQVLTAGDGIVALRLIISMEINLVVSDVICQNRTESTFLQKLEEQDLGFHSFDKRRG
jgi:DNA-binding NtrC family response regulator